MTSPAGTAIGGRFGSLTGVSLLKLNRVDKRLEFLLIEGLLTNVGGLLTLISSVPNIIVGNAAVTIIHKNKLAMPCGRFVKTAIPFAGAQIGLATPYVLLV